MKIVVSLQRQEGDEGLTLTGVRRRITEVSRDCVELFEQWPGSKWMTQTAEVKPKKRKEP